MLITIATLDAVTNAIKQGDQNRLNKISDFDFGSSVEFAAWAFSESESPIVHGLVTKFPTVAEASRLFQGGKPEPIGAFERSPNGLWSIRSREALDETSWELFLGRFTAALKREGFDRYNHALAEVLYEMTDNLIQHSTLGSQNGINGVVGYHIKDRHMTFVVADVGLGALHTLRCNPRHSAIVNGREALDKIAKEGASRRTGQGDGQGYKSLFLQLAAINGLVRLRSDDGWWAVQGDLACHTPNSGSIHNFGGFSVQVQCKI